MRMRSIPVLLLTLILLGCATQEEQYSGRDLSEASRVNTELGISYMQQGSLNLAMDALEKAVEQDRSNAQAHAVLGVLHERLEQFDRADASFRRSIRLESGVSWVHNNYGRFLCNRDDYDRAQRQFELAMRDPLYERRELPLANAGTCARRAGNYREASEYLRRALEHAPRFGPALFEMARVQYELEDYSAARSYYQRLRSVSELDADALLLGARIESALGNRDEAASLGLRLRADYPDSEALRVFRQMERDGTL
ncbi:type IV pilus biogenesis/stability protein PilW [Methylonatrum kenyense]|uniref:type IV pilus biogenesis/stability protein PilW n=1 Tax=Methylonatrum kenyense TaxID=455253 RepID=UPI0020C0049F|nr:type IV pilus biogenesis/stability protein PilW [Methylonatrum kenyense]MCK8515550.1 type IV pilus biogenesis/stability protein PilW [Methylonatrum kenyense]